MGQETQNVNVVTIESIDQLTSQVLRGQREAQAIDQVHYTSQHIDKCDGSAPREVRKWLTVIGGYLKDNYTQPQVLSLAKATSSGELLQELRAITTRAQEPVTEWKTADEELHTLFIPEADSLQLKHRFTTYQQLHGENTLTYVRRFKIDTTEAYGDTVSESDKSYLVGSFLRGLTDRTLAQKIFTTYQMS